MNKLTSILFIFVFPFMASGLQAQMAPGTDEGIDFLVTTGAFARSSMGDDDHVQIFFFTIPVEEKKPFFIQVFDPETGGKNDEAVGEFNTQCRFSLFGGKGCHSAIEARGIQPTGNFKSGNLIATKTFGVDPKTDGTWYAFGPINPGEGELMTGITGEVYAFKMICEGISGDDGNLYKYFMSTNPHSQVAVSGGKTFTYEYTFRLKKGIANLYPFVDDKVLKVRIQNFDFDNDGDIKLISHSYGGRDLNLASGDEEWKSFDYVVTPEDKDKFLNLRFTCIGVHKNNNISLFITNQYGEALPFFPVPLKEKLPGAGIVPTKIIKSN